MGWVDEVQPTRLGERAQERVRGRVGAILGPRARERPTLPPRSGKGRPTRQATEAGDFGERIFLYYEDLDLALRLAVVGGRCRLAPAARAVQTYSASLGAASADKYVATGWSRGYMLRPHGIAAAPRLALRAVAVEGALCAGQVLRDRTAAGLEHRAAAWQEPCRVPASG